MCAEKEDKDVQELRGLELRLLELGGFWVLFEFRCWAVERSLPMMQCLRLFKERKESELTDDERERVKAVIAKSVESARAELLLRIKLLEAHGGGRN